MRDGVKVTFNLYDAAERAQVSELLARFDRQQPVAGKPDPKQVIIDILRRHGGQARWHVIRDEFKAKTGLTSCKHHLGVLVGYDKRVRSDGTGLYSLVE